MTDSDSTLMDIGDSAIWLAINGEGDTLATVTKTVTEP